MFNQIVQASNATIIQAMADLTVEQKARIIALLAQSMQGTSVSAPPTISPHAINLRFQSSFNAPKIGIIATIKTCRTVFDLNLKHAKDLVESGLLAFKDSAEVERFHNELRMYGFRCEESGLIVEDR